jgi:hypothetical protein
MHTFPGVPHESWPDLPYETFMACVSYIDGGDDGEE